MRGLGNLLSCGSNVSVVAEDETKKRERLFSGSSRTLARFHKEMPIESADLAFRHRAMHPVIRRIQGRASAGASLSY